MKSQLYEKKYLHFNVGNGQPREPALCQLYRHTPVPYSPQLVNELRAEVTRTSLPAINHLPR